MHTAPGACLQIFQEKYAFLIWSWAIELRIFFIIIYRPGPSGSMLMVKNHKPRPKKKKYFAVPGRLPSRFVDDVNCHMIIPHLLGHMVLMVLNSMFANESNFKFIVEVISQTDLWLKSDFRNIWKFLHDINKPNMVPIKHQLQKEVIFWSGGGKCVTTWPRMTFDNLWSHGHIRVIIVSIYKVWFQWDVNFSNYATITLSTYLTTEQQVTFDIDVTFDLIIKCGFPCCICDPTLIETHQSMWKP